MKQKTYKKKTYEAKILAAKPNDPAEYPLKTINIASFRQAALKINSLLRAAKAPLPDGRTTYYEVNLLTDERKVKVVNHQ